MLLSILSQDDMPRRAGKKNAEGRMLHFGKCFLESIVYYDQFPIFSRMKEEVSYVPNSIGRSLDS